METSFHNLNIDVLKELWPICLSFELLADESRDLSQAGKKITVVKT